MKLHVIVPSYNESQNVPYFYGRAREALEAIPGLEWSLVFMNNSSEDDTLDQIKKLRAEDPRVKYITLSRNFGYHAALVAGLSTVEGDLYAIVDVDCEDPPELLADFFRAIQDGAQIAYGDRSNRDEPALITFGRKVFYLLNRGVADSEIVMWMGEFSMFTKQVRDAILFPKTTFISVRAEMGYVGFRRAGIKYLRAARKYGETHYNLWRMAVYAILSILSGTTFPLRLISYIALATGVAFPVVVLALGLSKEDTTFVGTLVALYFLVLTMPLVGLYLARVYKNIVHRPVFIVDHSRTEL